MEGEENMTKLVNKIFIMVILSFLVINLVGCDYGNSLYGWIEREIVNIELIYYDNPEAVYKSTLGTPFDFSRKTVISVICEGERIKTFIEELRRPWSVSGRPPTLFYSNQGRGIRIVYVDGGFSVITLSEVNGRYGFFSTIFDRDNNNESSWNVIGFDDFIEVFNSLIDRYFDLNT